jgi:hypothetical protein
MRTPRLDLIATTLAHLDTELRRAGFHDVGAGASPAMRRFERTRVPLA